MKTKMCVYALGLLCASSYAEDIVYTSTTKPSDTSSVDVSQGTATMLGVRELRHLKYHWKFDDETHLLTDAVSGLEMPVLAGAEQVFSDENPFFGAGCAFGATGGMVLPYGTFSPIIDSKGGKPFTVSFWFRMHDSTLTENKAKRLWFLGPDRQVVDATIDPSTRTISKTEYMDVMFDSSAPSGYLRFRTLCSSVTSAFSSDPQGRWVHVAIVGKPLRAWNGEDPNVQVVVYVDGLVRNTQEFVFDGGDNPIMSFGCGRQSTSKAMSCVSNTDYDQIMCFDAALSLDEIEWLGTHSAPYEFSAGWDIDATGTLDIYGSQSHQVRGTGRVTTDAGLLLNGDDGIFHGEIAGAALTSAKSPGKMQILTGEATYAGTTTVASGILKIDPALNVKNLPDFNSKVVAYYPFDDIENPGCDYSGNGNHLTKAVTAGFSGGVEWDGESTGPGSMTFRASGSDNQCLSSTTALKGFDEGGDKDAFMVGAWVKMSNIEGKSGFFAIGSSWGMRFNGSDNRRWYYGDSKLSFKYDYEPDYGKWMHVVIVYYRNAPSGTYKQQLYVNGALKHYGDDMQTTACSGASTLYVGHGVNTISGNRFDGNVDELFVLELPEGSTIAEIEADVLKMMNHRRASYTPTCADRVFPRTTTVSVAEGALLEITNACEEIKGVGGTGTIVIGSGARLTILNGGEIRNADSFGGVTGNGSLDLGENLHWSLDVALKRDEKRALFHVPAGFSVDDSVSGSWTIEGVDARKKLEWSVVDSVLYVNIMTKGLMLLLK